MIHGNRQKIYGDERMNGILVAGLFMLFFRTELSVVNESYLYFLSNIAGTILLLMNLNNLSAELKEKYKTHLLLYGFINITLLLLRFSDILIIGIGLSSFSSYILSLSMLVGQVIIFAYPLYLLTLTSSPLENVVSDNTYKWIARILKAAVLIMVLVFVTFFVAPIISKVGVLLVMILEVFAGSLILVKRKNMVNA